MTDTAAVETIEGRVVLLLDGTGPRLGGRDLLDAVADAGATVVACPVDRLDPAFFDLRTGVAGELMQALVNYRVVLAVVGPLPDSALASGAFMALVREANRGAQHWFVRDLAELRAHLARAGRRAGS